MLEFQGSDSSTPYKVPTVAAMSLVQKYRDEGWITQQHSLRNIEQKMQPQQDALLGLRCPKQGGQLHMPCSAKITLTVDLMTHVRAA